MNEKLIDIQVKPISNYNIVSGSPIPAIDRLKIISDTEYEECIAEWCVEYLKQKYLKVKRNGGSGDKGRDIVAYKNDAEDYDLYQCKHYKAPLSPSDIWIELGKLIYYTYQKEYKIPDKYYLVAPLGVGRLLSEYLENAEKLKQELINEWKDKCESKITKEKIIPLDSNLEAYILNFNFSIIKELAPFEFLEQYKTTKYFIVRFGGGLIKFREAVPETPIMIEKSEIVYVKQLLDAYSDFKKNKIQSDVELKQKYPDLFDHLLRQRKKFHSALALQRFVRDTLPDDSFFVRLQKDIYDGLIEIVNAEYNDGYQCVKEVLKEASRLQLSNIIVNHENFKFSIDDRGGICHQLANENKFNWVKK